MANDVAVSLPQMDLPPNCTLTVTLSDAGAKITQLNVHGWQEPPPEPPYEPTPGAFYLVPGA